jgi:hypothetical protein
MTTDWQSIINIVFALGGGLGGWILTTLWKEIKDARKDHSELRDALPNTYARRDDVKDGFRDINAVLNRIEGKLDGKADRER